MNNDYFVKIEDKTMPVCDFDYPDLDIEKKEIHKILSPTHQKIQALIPRNSLIQWYLPKDRCFYPNRYAL